jgi:nucleoside-diphosphate-sugar epimerase
MHIAVIGATGVLGRQVVPRLVERGHQVRAIVRQPAQAEGLQRLGVEAVLGDILDRETLVPATIECDAALHLATAIPKAGHPQDWSMNDRIRRAGTQNFVAACETSGLRRYVQQSITFLYGDHGGHLVDEEAALRPSPIVQSAVDMESFVQASRFEWCILRGGLFYGTGTGREEQWRQAAHAGALKLPGDGTALLSLVHVVDMARAAVMAIERAAARSIYNVVDDQPVDYRTLYHYLAAQANAPEPPPGGAVSLRGALVLPSLGCRNTRIKTELGWEPLYATYRSGLA